jgi:outer membrane protein assembly factor BamB
MRLFLMFALALCSLAVNGQGIKVTVDEFTGDTIISTRFVRMNPAQWSTTSPETYASFYNINGNNFFILKITTGVVLSVDRDSEVFIKFDDGEVLTLYNSEFIISERGAGAVGFNKSSVLGVALVLPLDNYSINTLTEKRISKCRFSTSQGYRVIATKKRKFSDNIRNAAKSIISATDG